MANFPEYDNATIDNNIKIGNRAVIAGDNVVAIGFRSDSSKDQGISIGQQSICTAEAGVALGAFSEVMQSDFQPREGIGPISVGNSTSNVKRRIINVANGINDNDAVTIAQLRNEIATLKADIMAMLQ